MAVTGSCHCGAVKIAVPRAPEWSGQLQLQLLPQDRLADGLLPRRWRRQVEGETAAYIWGDRMISLHHRPLCGCFTDWRSTGESHGKVASTRGLIRRVFDGGGTGSVRTAAGGGAVSG